MYKIVRCQGIEFTTASIEWDWTSKPASGEYWSVSAVHFSAEFYALHCACEAEIHSLKPSHNLRCWVVLLGNKYTLKYNGTSSVQWL